MTPPTQPPSFRVTLVSPTFADARDPRCLHCRATLNHDDNQHDALLPGAVAGFSIGDVLPHRWNVTYSIATTRDNKKAST
jgi:hypothetical protein